MLGAIIDELLVDFVGEDEDVFVERDIGQAGQFVLGVDGAGRIAGRVDDDHLGLRRHGVAEFVGRDLVVVLRLGRDDDRLRADELGHLGIAEPVGRGDDDFIARIERGEHGVEAGVLGAAGDDDLGGLVIESVVGLELLADGGTQFGNAGGRRVLGEAGVERPHGRGLDVLGRIEIGLAGAEADDVLALGFHGLGLAIDGKGE